jgi:predicted nuclease of predicted toxin-antitoxin system
MRIWIDECLSPSLTVTARDRGYESTCNLHRDMLGATDAELFATAPREDWTFATNNAGDFTELAAKADPHAGAIIVPQRLAADQPRILQAVLDDIEEQSNDVGDAPHDWLVDKVVEMNDDEQIAWLLLPK